MILYAITSISSWSHTIFILMKHIFTLEPTLSRYLSHSSFICLTNTQTHTNNLQRHKIKQHITDHKRKSKNFRFRCYSSNFVKYGESTKCYRQSVLDGSRYVQSLFHHLKLIFLSFEFQVYSCWPILLFQSFILHSTLHSTDHV